MDYDTLFMQMAIDAAWEYQLLTYPNPAVGAVVVIDGKILSVEAHQKAGSSHAEVRALLKAYENITSTKIDFDYNDASVAHEFLRKIPNNLFEKCTIFVTLEPCSHHGKTPSCASLLHYLNLKEVVVGVRDPIAGHDKGADILENVRFEVLEKPCQDLLKPFLIWQERALVVFKIAQTTNGRIGGGYLSCKESLTHTHKLRAVCSSMLIGGNTVRVDRPKLDCRFIDAKAPNVMIYTKKDDFNRDIPLFAVPGRDVSIVNNLSFLDKPSFILVEGGNGMVNALKEHIDIFLIYQTPRVSSSSLGYDLELNLNFSHKKSIGVDILLWSFVLR